MSDFIPSHSSGGGQSEEGARLVEPRVGTTRRRILQALRLVPEGCTGPELQACGGGSEATRRVRDLRTEGWPIECTHDELRGFVYRLTGWPT
jgi:hypothetical protein